MCVGLASEFNIQFDEVVRAERASSTMCLVFGLASGFDIDVLRGALGACGKPDFFRRLVRRVT